MRAWKRDLLRHESATGATLLVERRVFNRYLRGGSDLGFRMLQTETEFDEVPTPFIVMVKMKNCEPCNDAHAEHEQQQLHNSVVYIDSKNTELQSNRLGGEVVMFPTYFVVVDAPGAHKKVVVTKKDTLEEAKDTLEEAKNAMAQ